MIQTLNPRIYGLIYESDKIATEDRSYLTRKLMIEKGLTIFEEHPLTGIGLNNFDNIEVEFKGEFVGSEFVIEKEGTNETSSHNSYINIIAEGGLLLLIPLLLLMVFNLIQFVLKYNNRNSKINSLYWAFFAMCIHLYFITGIVNVYVWFLIAVCTAASTLSSFTQKT
jgi:O-antigen ligase